MFHGYSAHNIGELDTAGQEWFVASVLNFMQLALFEIKVHLVYLEAAESSRRALYLI